MNPDISIIAQVRRKYPGMNNQANKTGGIIIGPDTNCGIATVLTKNMTTAGESSLAGVELIGGGVIIKTIKDHR